MIRYAKRKDDEFLKLSIGVRRDLEDKMRVERINLKQALDTTNKRETDVAVDRCKLVCRCNFTHLLFLKSFYR